MTMTAFKVAGGVGARPPGHTHSTGVDVGSPSAGGPAPVAADVVPRCPLTGVAGMAVGELVDPTGVPGGVSPDTPGTQLANEGGLAGMDAASVAGRPCAAARQAVNRPVVEHVDVAGPVPSRVGVLGTRTRCVPPCPPSRGTPQLPRPGLSALVARLCPPTRYWTTEGGDTP